MASLGAAGPLRDAVAHPRRGARGRTRRRGCGAGQRATENGSVRALKLRWRGRIRSGWAAEIPVLHLDATLRAELVPPYLPHLASGSRSRPPRRMSGCVRSWQPDHRQGADAGCAAPERDRKTAAHHLRDLLAYVRPARLRAAAHRRGPDLLVIGQKAAIDALVPPAFRRASTPSTSTP